MVICFLTEIYRPFASGGGGHSIEAQAVALAGRGVRIVVLTPNYGAASRETLNGVEVRRAPFLRGGFRPRWLTNPLTYLYLTVWVAWQVWRLRADILHIQTKHMLVPGVLAGKVVRCSTVFTIRDLGVIDATMVCMLKPPPRPESEAEWVERAVRNIEVALQRDLK